MLAISRQNLIKELLQENKSVTIADLAVRMNVTRETIRRDLRAMEQEHELIRTHGGAYILDGVQNDLDISTRQVLKTEEKKTIALKCDALIQTGEIIYLDNSTTAWFIANKIASRKLTVVTNSLEIANILSSSQTINLFLIGPVELLGVLQLSSLKVTLSQIFMKIWLPMVRLCKDNIEVLKDSSQ